MFIWEGQFWFYVYEQNSIAFILIKMTLQRWLWYLISPKMKLLGCYYYAWLICYNPPNLKIQILKSSKIQEFLIPGMMPQKKISHHKTLFYAQNYLQYSIKLFPGMWTKFIQSINEFHIHNWVLFPRYVIFHYKYSKSETLLVKHFG